MDLQQFPIQPSTPGAEYLNSQCHDSGAAVQLIQIWSEQDETKIQLVNSTINKILALSGNRPIVPICICGPSREGKSFLCSNLIRCLLAAEKGNLDNWMDYKNPRKPLEPRFEFKNCSNPVTKGIWIWDRPFIINQKDSKEIAVLVIDTQGTYDEFTDDKDMVSIVGLSLLMSSHVLFNFSKTLREDTLGCLETYISYGEMIQNQSGNKVPYQDLTFLIRDFAFGDEYGFGPEAGRKFIQDKLQIKPNHTDAPKRVRAKIDKCFENVSGFVMPHPGKAIGKVNYDGNIADLDPEFLMTLDDLITSLVSVNLKVKSILGKSVLANEWAEYIRQHIEAYNSPTIPSSVSSWEATASAADKCAVDEALSKYNSHIETALKASEYLPKRKFEAANEFAKGLAKNCLESSQHFGKIDTLMVCLNAAILEKQILFQTRNSEMRAQVLGRTKRAATEKFEMVVAGSLPWKDGNVYTDEQIFRETEKAFEKALEYPATVTSDEEPDVQAQILADIKKELDHITTVLKIDLKNNKDKAEQQLLQKITEIAAAYKAEINLMIRPCNITESTEDQVRQHFDQFYSEKLSDLVASSKFCSKSSEYAKFETKLSNKLSLILENAVTFVKDHLTKKTEEIKENAKQKMAEALDSYGEYMETDLSQDMFDSEISHLKALNQAHFILDPVLDTLDIDMKSQVLSYFEKKVNERYKLHKDHVAIKLDNIKLQDEQQRLFEAQRRTDQERQEEQARLEEQDRQNHAKFEEHKRLQEERNEFHKQELQESERRHQEQTDGVREEMRRRSKWSWGDMIVGALTLGLVQPRH